MVGKLNNAVIAGERNDGTVVSGFAFFSEEAAGHLAFSTMVGDTFATAAAFIAGISAGAVL